MNTTTSPEQQIEGNIGSQDKPQGPRTGRSNKLVYAIGGLFLAIAVIAAVGFGLWSFQLNTRLTATQNQLVSLQGDYAKMKADLAKLTTDLSQTNSSLDQTKADLDTAKSDLAKAQADLGTANSEVAARRAQMDTAKKLSAVLEAIVNGEDAVEIGARVVATGDAQLISSWRTLVQTPTQENSVAFTEYLFRATSAALQ